MEKWVLSVVGIVALGVLVDVLLPSSDITKYIKGVFAVMTISVVFAPVPNFLHELKNGNIDFIANSADTEYQIDEGFIDEMSATKISSMEENLKKILESNGITTREISIKYNSSTNRINRIYCVIDDMKNEYRARKLIVDTINIRSKEVIIEDGKRRD